MLFKKRRKPHNGTLLCLEGSEAETPLHFFCFCFALLYIIYKDLYIYFTFALRFTCAMRNVPAGTSRLRKTLTMPDRQALLREAQAINPCMIDVGARYRDWLWHCFFSDSIKSNAKTKCTNCWNQEENNYPHSDPALQTLSSRLQHVKRKQGLEYPACKFKTRTRTKKLAYQLETPTELSAFCCGNLVSHSFRFAKLNLTAPIHQWDAN